MIHSMMYHAQQHTLEQNRLLECVDLWVRLEQDGLDISMTFIQEAEAHMLFDKPNEITVQCPVRIVHGMGDTVVPHGNSLALIQHLQSVDVKLILIKVSVSLLSCEPALPMQLCKT